MRPVGCGVLTAPLTLLLLAALLLTGSHALAADKLSSDIQARIKFERAKLALEKKDWAGALTQFEEVMKLVGDHAEVLYNAAQAAHETGQVEKAHGYITKLFTTADDDFKKREEWKEAFKLAALLEEKTEQMKATKAQKDTLWQKIVNGDAASQARLAKQGKSSWENSLGMKFVPVPNTSVLFCIWETRLEDYAAFAAANPNVSRDWWNFYYNLCSKEVLPGPAHPVQRVSWEDAKRFCGWLTEKERREAKIPAGASYRLPTDAEWSHAVGIGDGEGSGTPSKKDLRGTYSAVYPWGRQWPPPSGAGNYFDESFRQLRPDMSANLIIEDYNDGYPTTAPVGSFTPNKHGIYDLGGNVMEWCEDWIDEKEKDRTTRGCSWFLWNTSKYGLLSTSRGRGEPDKGFQGCGFRVVLVGGSAR